MQSTNNQVERSLTQVATLLNGNPNMEAKEIDMQDFSRILTKMPFKQHKDTVNAVIQKLFEVAGGKMKDDHDKAVIEGLKKYVLAA